MLKFFNYFFFIFRMDFDFELELELNLENIINHVVFPIRLPNSQKDGDFYEFLDLTCNALSSVFKETHRESNEILRLFNSWKTLQSSNVVILVLNFCFIKDLIVILF